MTSITRVTGDGAVQPVADRQNADFPPLVPLLGWPNDEQPVERQIRTALSTLMVLFSLPSELLHEIVGHVDSCANLLALAQTCTFLRDIIIPAHLEYRDIVVSDNHRSFWEHLIQYPVLAMNIRRLTLICRSDMRTDPLSYWRLPSAFIHDSSRVDGEKLAFALSGMRNLQRLDMRCPKYSAYLANSRELDVFTVACSSLTGIVEEFRIVAANPMKVMRPLLDMSGLRSLDLEYAGVVSSPETWMHVCSMLRHSLLLERLRLPVLYIDPSTTPTPIMMRMPHLPHLRSLSFVFRRYTPLIVTSLVLNILFDHPMLEELQWVDLPRRLYMFQPLPPLPDLNRIQKTTDIFITQFLRDREKQSVDLEMIGPINLSPGMLQSLLAVNPDTLRKLHIKDLPSYDALRSLAKMFPTLETLYLPSSCAWNQSSITKWIESILFPQHQTFDGPVPIHRVVPLFRRLRVVDNVGMDSSIIHHDSVSPRRSPRNERIPAHEKAKLRALYPHLEIVNGCSLTDQRV